MSISYAVTVCNEFIEIQRLLAFLMHGIRKDDEIVVLVDLRKNTQTSELLGYLHKLSSSNRITLVEDTFNDHFADWKNRLTRACTKDYIFQIDADELPTHYMMDFIPEVLKLNKVDVLKVPRVNTVKGLTEEHIQKWGWNVNDKGWINFPDHQWRIYRNTPEIKWKNKVHEVLEGYETISYLPSSEEWSLIHDKTITKQEKQNEYYGRI